MQWFFKGWLQKIKTHLVILLLLKNHVRVNSISETIFYDILFKTKNVIYFSNNLIDNTLSYMTR